MSWRLVEAGRRRSYAGRLSALGMRQGKAPEVPRQGPYRALDPRGDGAGGLVCVAGVSSSFARTGV